jgi:mono/diheme cytochrome c family protein
VRVGIAFAVLFAACFCGTVQAAGEHDQRLAAELAVMTGDVRRLIKGEGGPREREGLVKRISGALSSLPLLLRRAGADPTPVSGLRLSLGRGDWRAVSLALSHLRRRHPFDARRLLPATPTPEMLELGAAIHYATCRSCHDASAADRQLPARNLSQQLRSMPREEFAARLLLGVRGDRTTSWTNPFNEPELAALLTWYASAESIPAGAQSTPRPSQAPTPRRQ